MSHFEMSFEELSLNLVRLRLRRAGIKSCFRQSTSRIGAIMFTTLSINYTKNTPPPMESN